MNPPPGDPERRSRKLRGDFQTPPALADRVLDRLGPDLAGAGRILEPSCGRGSFLAGALRRARAGQEVVGIEVHPGHIAAARAAVAEVDRPEVACRVEHADLFDADLAGLGWSNAGPMLVVGNLPWVTVADLGAGGEPLRAPRVNVRNVRGINARTGASNFDIAEALTLRLIRDLAPARPTIALLSKLATARSLFRSIDAANLPIESIAVERIDALRWFGANVEAGLLIVRVGPGPRAGAMPIYPELGASEPETTLVRDGRDGLAAASPARPRVAKPDRPAGPAWRQGIKHDAAEVMELIDDHGTLRNKRGEPVDVEPDYLYPLVKGGDLAGVRSCPRRRYLIVPQRGLADGVDLERDAPRLWSYLSAHAADFDRRRSSIYRGRHRFAIFGVGPYSFAPYKVAVSGLHKDPAFRVVGPVAGRPVVFDDTCYLLPFDRPEAAAEAADLLNGPTARAWIASLSFRDAKRPITKAVLSRLDLDALRAIGPHPGPREPAFLAPVPTPG